MMRGSSNSDQSGCTCGTVSERNANWMPLSHSSE
eukprot:CAMPEP_0119173372 /NCGR_PEP_ID=MMETSP1315-20130426/33371_1 /TAXON_ID=676789 /ORGANISM="Prasinoderma singularis, Strain RCC927" /LENGTH=33 /DNA_ID= /DNA_START= /DNA_END= /DNA_ORIENTATION=